MSAQVTAAIIAASVGVLTVIATVAVQISGRRATSRDTQKALEEQRKQLDRTLAEQRTRTLNERFATAAGQLGDDKPPAVRLAGVYAMAGLAEDWPENQQTCVDVLCGYLRMPYEPDPGDEAPGPARLAFQAGREVRHTAIRVIAAHLQEGAAVSWQGLNFDFTGVVFDGGAFEGVVFSDGRASFADAVFSDGVTSFAGAVFSGGQVSFTGARFSGGTVDFNSAAFSGGRIDFFRAEFSDGVVYFGVEFSGATVSFRAVRFSGATVYFGGARFSGSTVRFSFAMFSGGTVDFGSDPVLTGAEFSNGRVDFSGAEFSGAAVRFDSAVFSGCRVDFSGVRDWSVQPAFPWTGTPPPGVTLPRKEDQSQT